MTHVTWETDSVGLPDLPKVTQPGRKEQSLRRGPNDSGVVEIGFGLASHTKYQMNVFYDNLSAVWLQVRVSPGKKAYAVAPPPSLPPTHPILPAQGASSLHSVPTTVWRNGNLLRQRGSQAQERLHLHSPPFLGPWWLGHGSLSTTHCSLGLVS